MTSPSSACGRQAKTIYVDINAPAGGDGSVNNPFKHINDAAQVALPGDEVLVAPGIYREYVDPKNAGTEDARITYRSAEPLGAEITGAEIIKDWKPFNRMLKLLKKFDGLRIYQFGPEKDPLQ